MVFGFCRSKTIFVGHDLQDFFPGGFGRKGKFHTLQSLQGVIVFVLILFQLDDLHITADDVFPAGDFILEYTVC